MAVSAGRSRWSTFLVHCLTALFLCGLVLPRWQAVRCQDPPAEEQPKADASKAGDESKTGESGNPIVRLIKTLVYIVKSVGWFMGIVLGLVSIALVALIVLLIMDLRMSSAIPPAFVQDFTDTVNKRKFKEAFDLARADSSFLGSVLTAGMGRLQYGIEDSRETAFNMVETIRASKEQFIAYLATIGTLGPMLGLVGTVFGMIGAFRVLATNDPGALAENLAHALCVTLLGIFLSLPAIFCHAFFRNRLIRISMETSNLADELLTQMYHNTKKTSSTSTGGDSRVGIPTAAAVKTE